MAPFGGLFGRKSSDTSAAVPQGPADLDAAGLAQFFTADHKICDGMWAAVEAAVQKGGDAAAAWQAFDRNTRRHLEMEEKEVFPRFEEHSPMGACSGPTVVMRSEHQQIRGVLDQMGEAAGAGLWQEVLDLGETLLYLTQQHNAKEEGILYPMAEQFLHGLLPELKKALRTYL